MLTLLVAAQDINKPITFLPQQANGILIFNTVTFPTVTSWKVDIETRSTDPQTNEFIYKSEQTLSLSAYYLKMDSRYLDGNHYVAIQGIDARGSVVTSEGPEKIGPHTTSGICSWRCIGHRYAYQLNLVAGDNEGNSHVIMVEPTPPDDYPYYYQWIPASQWYSWTTYNDPAYYHLSSFSTSQPENYDVIIQTTIPSSSPVHDEDGIEISGNVYGVRKYFGDWNDLYSQMHSNEFAYGPDELCGQSFDWAMNSVNAGSPGYPPLTCNGVSWGDYDGSVQPVDGESDGYSDDCIDLLSDLVASSGDAEIGLGLFDIIDDCSIGFVTDPEGNGDNGNSSGGHATWPDAVASITFEPYLATSHVRPVVLSDASMFDEHGNYIGKPFTIGAGLNHMVIKFKNGHYKRAYFIAPRDRKIGLTQSDFVTATVFPVPITGNDYTLELKATAHVSFTYVLSDVNGNPLYHKSYELQKGDDLRDVISVARGIPGGILFNQLQFSDGSQTSFQTMK